MIRMLMALAFAGLGASQAQATTWGDYEESFPAFPCLDGWTACYQDGIRITPDLIKRAGKPSPANARVDWFTLEPTSAFSPFVTLSAYQMGGAPVVVAPEPMVDPEPMIEPEPYVAPEPRPVAADPDPRPASQPMGRPDPEPTTMVRPDPMPTGRPTPEPSGMVRPGSTPTPAPALVRPDPEPSTMVRPGSTPAPTPEPSLVRPDPEPSTDMVRPGSTPAPTNPAPVTTVAPAVAVEPAPTPAPGMVRPGTEPAGEATCDDLVRLESSALIGRLSDEQIACLEASFADASRQTDKKKISLLLIANANGKGDKRKWEDLVRRHLEDIDQSDPDLCYAYATHLARKGPGRATSVIRWSEIALENRMRWVGETYKSRVYGLYKLRAAAANTLWQRAEERHAASQSDETEDAVERTRGTLKTYAREWYEYAKEAGKDTTTPLQLCVSAAGTSEFCEGR